MKVISTSIHDLMIIEPKVFGDERGFFFESFNQKKFCELTGANVEFVQDNHSKSTKGVVRGLHYQLDPWAQGKLIRCLKGEIFDVAVDIRADSPTFGKWFSVVLTEENKKQLWIPAGFAHGFMALSDEVEVAYKATEYYQPSAERSLKWNDESINIDWPKLSALVSSKDELAPTFAEVFGGVNNAG